jgi:predicted permease
VTILWAVGYATALFVDRSLEPLAQSITPLMMIVVGAIFGQELLELRRGKTGGDDDA